jgi:hypothetical protein
LDDERVDPSFAIHERKQYIAYNAVNMDQTKLGGSAKFRSCEIRSKNFHKLKQLSQSRGTLEDLKKPKRQRQSRRRHRLHYCCSVKTSSSALHLRDQIDFSCRIGASETIHRRKTRKKEKSTGMMILL